MKSRQLSLSQRRAAGRIDIGERLINNGVVASLAITEFMVMVTGLRPPKRLSTYHGHTGKVMVSLDEPAPDCYYCKGVRISRDASEIREYIKTIGPFLR